MKKRLAFISLVLCAVLLFLCACSSGGDPGKTAAPAGTGTQELRIRESDEYPASIRYERGETAEDRAKTGDRYTMDDVLEALDAMAVKEAVTPAADAAEEAIVFVYADGTEERVEFRGEALLKNGAYYRLEGFEALRTVLDKMMENFGGYDHPYAFTATPFRDDRDGYYWIFFEAGHGARFTGFDGDWFVGEQLFQWGVDDGVLHIFPVGGEEETYPVAYGETVDDDNIYLGEVTLNEVYPKELDALYVQWVPIGKKIAEKLGADE